MSTSMMRGRTAALLITASLSALATPALAQQTPTPQADAAQAGTAEEDTGEIVVIAQGREQLLSDVPVAVSAVNAEALQNSGANDIRALNQIAPSLLVSSTSSEANGSARIRGIGTVGDNPGLESSVAVFVDGVYRSRSGIGLNELGEIERIEVLRGPQGTLGGRNASAGVINIISVKPSFDFGGNFEATYGNYDYLRFAAGVTGPITETLAARIDGVAVDRTGFYNDPSNNRSVNDRNRYFVRGQLLWEPNDGLSVRLIGDYTNRSEQCCGAIYIDNTVSNFVGDLNNLAVPLSTGATGTPPNVPPANGNNIVNVLRDLGQPLARLTPGYNRDISVTPGRSYLNTTEEGGVSLSVDADLGGARLTSITAYRVYENAQAQDADYSTVDILYRSPIGGGLDRKFQTFSQELRLQGEVFNGALDFLIGAYFANEDLTLTDNLRFGNQYGRFINCRIVSGGGLAALYSPTSPGCLAARPPAFGAASPLIYGALDRLETIGGLGATTDRYAQNSRNWALFTHNIIHLSDTFDITLGLRYTNERKTLDATFGNNNTVCTGNQAALLPLLSGPLAATAGAIITLSCLGNSTAELNNVSINGRRSEDQFTGTAIMSWRPTDDLLLYGSYSRGYKAGGFNLDRSALKGPILPFSATPGGAQAFAPNLQFDPETVTSFEIGAKYATRAFSVSVAAFRQEFSSFQLNTFNGQVFLVQNINGCTTSLAGLDRDTSNTTGVCPVNDVGWGVRAQGVEVEAVLNPSRDIRVAAGFTYANTSYRNDLVGTAQGAPLANALRKLPGDNLSNAPEIVATTSFAWTPELGGSGLSALVYFDGRLTSDFNTGSDLFPQKEQDSFAVFNARLGLRGPDESWSLELWAQNIFNKQYAQIGFNTPLQEGTRSGGFNDPQYPGGRQLFSQFLAEPRTYGITLRGRF